MPCVAFTLMLRLTGPNAPDVTRTCAAQSQKRIHLTMGCSTLLPRRAGAGRWSTSSVTLDVPQDGLPSTTSLTNHECNQPPSQIVSGHPPVLSYSVSDRLGPFWDYMTSIGVADVGAAVVSRPSLLGLDVDANLRKIVEYLQVGRAARGRGGCGDCGRCRVVRAGRGRGWGWRACIEGLAMRSGAGVASGYGLYLCAS